MEKLCTNKNQSYKHNLCSLRNRLEKLAKCSLFYLFLKLVQINFIFSDNVRVLYIHLYTKLVKFENKSEKNNRPHIQNWRKQGSCVLRYNSSPLISHSLLRPFSHQARIKKNFNKLSLSMEATSLTRSLFNCKNGGLIRGRLLYCRKYWGMFYTSYIWN